MDHPKIVECGFLCVVEQPSTVPGFEPSIRELPKETFLPKEWNSHLDSICLIYKLRSRPGKIYSLTTVAFDDAVVITFSQRNAGEASAEVELSRFIVGSSISSTESAAAQATLSDTSSTSSTAPETTAATAPVADATAPRIGSFLVNNDEALESTLSTLVERIVPGFVLAQQRSRSHGSSQSFPSSSTIPQQAPFLPAPPARGSQYYPPPSRGALGSDPAGGGFAPAAPIRGPLPSLPVGVIGGRNDLDPFSNITMPGSRLPAPGTHNGGPLFPSAGGSNLVGPDHPFFRDPYGSGGGGGYPGAYPGGGLRGGPRGGLPGSIGGPPPGQQVPPPSFLPGFAPPQPRYDPTGPVFPHNQGVEFGFAPPDIGARGVEDFDIDIEPIPGPNGELIYPGRPHGPGGRGGGRGGAGRGGGRGGVGRFPGEPAPDHQRPPGW